MRSTFPRATIQQWMLDIRVEKEQKFRELGCVPNEKALNNTFKGLAVRLRITEANR